MRGTHRGERETHGTPQQISGCYKQCGFPLNIPHQIITGRNGLHADSKMPTAGKTLSTSIITQTYFFVTRAPSICSFDTNLRHFINYSPLLPTTCRQAGRQGAGSSSPFPGAGKTSTTTTNLHIPEQIFQHSRKQSGEEKQKALEVIKKLTVNRHQPVPRHSKHALRSSCPPSLP